MTQLNTNLLLRANVLKVAQIPTRVNLRQDHQILYKIYLEFLKALGAGRK